MVEEASEWFLDLMVKNTECVRAIRAGKANRRARDTNFADAEKARAKVGALVSCKHMLDAEVGASDDEPW